MQVQIKAYLGFFGGYLSYILGGFDTMLSVLVTLIVIDYLTGIISAAYNKEISSYIGFKGILKKMLIFCVVCLASLIDIALKQDLIRNIAVFFYISNEGISILENVVECDVPVPKKLSYILKIIKNKDSEEDIKENDLNLGSIENEGGETDD